MYRVLADVKHNSGTVYCYTKYQFDDFSMCLYIITPSPNFDYYQFNVTRLMILKIIVGTMWTQHTV